MRRVILECPFAAPDEETAARNRRYARDAIHDSLGRGEAPLWSPALYALTGALDDAAPSERDLGLRAGWAWMRGAHAVAVYEDLGVSPGMQAGIERALAAGHPVERRSLPAWCPAGAEQAGAAGAAEQAAGNGVAAGTSPPAPAPHLAGDEAVRTVLRVVADLHGVKVADLRGTRHGSRLAHVVRPRHEAAYFLRQTGMSYPAIGRALGGRDHSTIMHSVRLVEGLQRKHAEYRGHLLGVLRLLASHGVALTEEATIRLLVSRGAAPAVEPMM